MARRTQLPSSAQYVTPASIAHSSGQWVVVGSSGLSDEAKPATWYSADGQHWTAGTITLGDPDTTSATLNAVAYRAHQWIAVGTATSFGQLDAAVWTSTDGQTWTRPTPNDPVLAGAGTQAMNTVASGSTGWVAAGYENLGGDANAATWNSKDGIHWTRGVENAARDLGGTGDQDIASVTQGANGLWVAGDETPSTNSPMPRSGPRPTAISGLGTRPHPTWAAPATTPYTA